MTKFLLWLLLLFVCWPLALLALVLYPFVWLLTLPFRLIGITHNFISDLKTIHLYIALIIIDWRILTFGLESDANDYS